MRTCPFDGCCETLPSHIFACREHWFAMKADHRQAVRSAWWEFEDGKIDVAELRARQEKVLQHYVKTA